MLFLSIWDDLTLSINNALRTFLLAVCELIYTLIIFCYNAFEKLGNAEILADSQISAIYSRIGLILGMFMVFRIAFSGISYLINPDAMLDKKKGMGNVVKKTVIAIVLLGVTPSLFKTAYQIQRMIINEHIIAKVITGENASYENVGSDLSWYLFSTFYNINEDVTPSTNESCPEYSLIENNFEKNFKYTYNCVNLTSKVTDPNSKGEVNTAYTINFNGLLAVIAGALMLWTIVTFTIIIAMRVLQLAYLQLIAPIPIMTYMTPKGEDTLNNWLKQCTSAYAEFFVRTAIIYFVAYIFEILKASDMSVFKDSLGDVGTAEYRYLIITMIIALFYFAKKIPDLIKEIFPSIGGKASFGFKDSLGIAKKAATFGAGVAVGGIAGAATGIKHGEGFRGKLAGAFGGLGRGAASAKTKGNIFKNAQSGMNSTRAARQRAYEKSNDGSTFWGRNFTAGNAARMVDEFDRETTFNDNYLSGVDSLKKELAKDKFVQKAQAEYESLMQTGIKRDGTVATAIDYKNAKDAIKNAEQNAYRNELIKPGSNPGLRAQIDRLDVLGREGQKRGYTGFVNFVSSSDSSKTAADRTTAFWDTEKNVKVENADIKTPGGKKYQQRETAKANAKYNKKGK